MLSLLFWMLLILSINIFCYSSDWGCSSAFYWWAVVSLWLDGIRFLLLQFWMVAVRTCTFKYSGDGFMNKKVLLRERKRHTARRVAGPWPRRGTFLGWGVPTLGCPPILIWLGGTYLGVPPSRVWTDKTPVKRVPSRCITYTGGKNNPVTGWGGLNKERVSNCWKRLTGHDGVQT